MFTIELEIPIYDPYSGEHIGYDTEDFRGVFEGENPEELERRFRNSPEGELARYEGCNFRVVDTGTGQTPEQRENLRSLSEILSEQFQSDDIPF